MLTKLLTPKIGIELEFYLTQYQEQILNEKTIDDFIENLSLEIDQHKIQLLKIEKEQGQGQIEIKTLPYTNIKKLSSDLKSIKNISQNLAKKSGFGANFEPSPFLDDCSSALQINLSILNQKQQNIFNIPKDQSFIVFMTLDEPF